MKIIKNGNLYQIIFMPNIFPVNCYFVEEDKELTLVDAALPFSYKGILETSEKIGKPITRIVLTHAHGDHVGALDKLKDALPQAEVLISVRDARLLAGDMSLEPNEPNTIIRGGVPKTLKTVPDTLLKEGDQIGSLLAVSSPGHTPGSMSFLDQRDHSLLAGDAFQTRGGIAVAGKVNILFPFPAFGTWNKIVSIESARKLRDLKPSLLAIGHGSLLIKPEVLMNKALHDAETSIQRG